MTPQPASIANAMAPEQEWASMWDSLAYIQARDKCCRPNQTDGYCETNGCDGYCGICGWQG